MFLKSIEIRGFKSFADKTELSFKQGVTVVVGPNGSGKSNISDAVRWVLGEQSIRNLRGDKMEDVIFAGTQFRKPVGLAQVSLTLDNSDADLDIAYSQVTVSRRLYRSGESEYLINNTPCRLKDVQALFMDTGIGKEGYSIIGQGKIDAILSAKSEDRRKLLEEAAGIVKFKTRKEEAEKKLDNTQQNLVRIDDILATYEERLPSLKEDAEKAREFISLSEEVKIKEVNIITDFLERTKNNKSNIAMDVKRAENHKQEIEKDKAQLKQQLDEKNKALEEFSGLVERKRQLYYETQSKHQEIQNNVKLYEEKISYITDTIKRLENEDLKKQEFIRSQEENLQKLVEKLSTYKIQESGYNEKIAEAEAEIQKVIGNLTLHNDRIEELDRIKEDNKNQINTLTSEKGILDNNIQITSEAIEKLILEVQTSKNSILINNRTREYLEKEQETILAKIKDYEEQVRTNKKNLTKGKQDLDHLESELKDTLKNQSNKEARLNALVALENSYEGYNKAVKALMQHVEENNHYVVNEDCFVLGDIIKVPERYERAMEIAIGGSISNIVTKNESIAKDLINHLKKTKLGRATFMPMDIVKGRTLAIEKVIKEARGYVGIASELIEYEDRFKGIMDHLLGKTLVCETMDNGSYISKLCGHKYKIVTLDGEVFNPGGTLTGGAYTKNANVIGRKREIADLKEAIEKSHTLVDEKNKIIADKYDEMKKLDDAGLNLRDEIHYENINNTKITAEISKAMDEENRNQKVMERAKLDLQNGKLKLEAMKQKGQEIDTTLEDLNRTINSCEEEYNSLTASVKDKNYHVDKLKDNLTSVKIDRAKIAEIISSSEADIMRIKDVISGEKDNVNSNSSQIEQLHQELTACKDNITSGGEKISEIVIELKELDKFFEDSEVERLKLREKLPAITSQIEGIDLQMDKLEKELHRFEITMTKIEAEEESQLSKLNEEYNMTFAEALSYKLEEYDVSALKHQVAALKKQISELGLVNLGAIEEYKEVNEKYTFMNDQREDLVKSKEEIEGFIEKMTETMRRVFVENFKQLRMYFDETFKELFKGGRADLTLQGDDELTCKIEINVEPPGKKLQNINLLSGGEKVLSAIALLFAILKMKPTPFCILDEIEAALDDANVLRYGEFLKKFSKSVQFIVITHRKGTMETSDAIYGVTMEEKGVSKIVSLELTK